MQEPEQHVVNFYLRHPISADHIVANLTEERDNLKGLRPEELYAHDQDHYGALEAKDALARQTGMISGKKIADFCAGLAGPARYWATRYDVDATGVELSPNRVEGANELTRLVGLNDRVRVLQGDVLDVPLPADAFDAVVSQEALLHVPDKSRAIGEAYRVFKPGGRLAFTDWIVHRPLQAEDAREMWQGRAVQTVQTISGYESILSHRRVSSPLRPRT